MGASRVGDEVEDALERHSQARARGALVVTSMVMGWGEGRARFSRWAVRHGRQPLVCDLDEGGDAGGAALHTGMLASIVEGLPLARLVQRARAILAEALEVAIEEIDASVMARAPEERRRWLDERGAQDERLRVAIDIVGSFVDGVGLDLAVRPTVEDDATDTRANALVEIAGPIAILVIASDAGRVGDAAVILAKTLPRAHVAVVIDAGTAEALWSKTDRVSTVLRQWLVRPALPSRAAEGGRSQAERDLWLALERDTRTRGRFRLGERIDVRHGGQPAEIDLYDRELAVAVEVDGIYHFRDVESFRRDRRKDVALQRAGILIYRVHTDDVANRVEHEVDVIAGLLTFRRAARASVRRVP